MQPTVDVGPPWWIPLIAGIALTIVGFLLISAPGMTLITLTTFLGIYWLIDGLVRIVSIFVDHSNWFLKLVIGIVGIFIGLLTLQHPLWASVIIPTTLVFMVGFAGLFIGLLEIVSAFMGGGWATGILGAVSLVFGLLILFNPVVGAAALPMALGLLGIIGGIATVILSATVVRTGGNLGFAEGLGK
jgi:uncharacterized membrane protein HdeD (DUF308 family)